MKIAPITAIADELHVGKLAQDALTRRVDTNRMPADGAHPAGIHIWMNTVHIGKPHHE